MIHMENKDLHVAIVLSPICGPKSSRIIERSSDSRDVPLSNEDYQRVPAHKVILFPVSCLLQDQHG